jgi:hypothetical protein
MWNPFNLLKKEKYKMNYGQQGDILFFESEFPLESEEIKNGVILHSDATNHTHKVHGGKLVMDKNKAMFVSTSELAIVKHEEHNDLVLPAGTWRIQIVREYSHFDEEARNVID